MLVDYYARHGFDVFCCDSWPHALCRIVAGEVWIVREENGDLCVLGMMPGGANAHVAHRTLCAFRREIDRVRPLAGGLEETGK